MIILGIVLILVGLLVPQLSILFTIGIVILVIGLVLIAMSARGHPVGGRRWY